MKKVVATEAPQPRSELAKRLAWVYVAILVVMAVGQLYAFEDFAPLIADYELPLGGGVAAVIVVLEVFALPFLLRMRLSPLMRLVSLGCSLAAAAVWVKLSLWAILTDHMLANSGLLGTKVAIPAGQVSLLLSSVLLLLAAYCALGLWPIKRKKTS